MAGRKKQSGGEPLRMYAVTFEVWDRGRWQQNSFVRSVCVGGGAAEAMALAEQREAERERERAKDYGKEHTPVQSRVESVRLIATED